MISRFLSVGMLLAVANVFSCGTPLMCLAAKASVSSAEEVRTGAHEEAAARVGQKLAHAAAPWSDFHKRGGE